jgi:hypothetical protein
LRKTSLSSGKPMIATTLLQLSDVKHEWQVALNWLGFKQLPESPDDANPADKGNSKSELKTKQITHEMNEQMPLWKYVSVLIGLGIGSLLSFAFGPGVFRRAYEFVIEKN